MSVLIKLRDQRNLSEAENQVREYILRYPKRVLEYTVYDLARESFTSPATIVRLCKKLDIKGFSRLKVLLAEETKYFQNIKLNLLDTTTIEKDDSPGAIIDKITNISIKTIEETRVLVNEEELLRVARHYERRQYHRFLRDWRFQSGSCGRTVQIYENRQKCHRTPAL